MIEALISAEAECTERVDISPGKVLRPIGTVFKDWNDCPNSTATPHWNWWEVVGYIESFRYRNGDTLMYERMEEIKLTERKE